MVNTRRSTLLILLKSTQSTAQSWTEPVESRSGRCCRDAHLISLYDVVSLHMCCYSLGVTAKCVALLKRYLPRSVGNLAYVHGNVSRALAQWGCNADSKLLRMCYTLWKPFVHRQAKHMGPCLQACIAGTASGTPVLLCLTPFST